MKVVLFCGGFGTRLREYSETVPKPMAEIGYRPIILHLMRYYAHFGHNEFILSLGDKWDVIKRYFLEYDECLSNDFVLTKGGRHVQLSSRDVEDWTISFVDTGLNANIGQRLVAVRKHLGDDPVFMANYADGLTDLDLNTFVNYFQAGGRTASFLCVRPSQSLHSVSLDERGRVTGIRPIGQTDLWINGGFFIFKREIFDYIGEGEDLVEEPFARLIACGQLLAYRNPGFWACMDTFKEKKMLDEMYARGEMPWAVWETAHDLTRPRITSERSPLRRGGDGGSLVLKRNTHPTRTYVP